MVSQEIISGANSRHAHHATGSARFSTVGKQQIYMAVCAQRRSLDVLPGHTSREQLPPIRLDEVEENLLRQ
jgi:hypothetical protein